MSQSIEKIMQTLASMHQQFSNQQYQLSSIDKGSIRQLIEQLHTELITEKHAPSNNRVIPQPQVVPQPAEVTEPHLDSFASTTPVEQFNEEIESVFSAPEQQEVIPPTNRDQFQLGINERIMFAKELFDDDVNTLHESIQKLRTFETKEDAIDFFTKQFAPFLLDEGKDEEIIQEFGQLIHRFY